MDFLVPDGPRFTIPDDWWVTAGMQDFRPISNAYLSATDPECPITRIVPVLHVEPPRRAPGIELDSCGFDRERMISILRGFISSDLIPSVRVNLYNSRQYQYAVYNGFHRFYASVAAGYDNLPIAVADWGA